MNAVTPVPVPMSKGEDVPTVDEKVATEAGNGSEVGVEKLLEAFGVEGLVSYLSYD